MPKQIIYIAGPDGSGKTTFLKDIEKFYIEKGEKTNHIWLRSPKIFSKPLMLYCRITGLTKYKVIDGVKYGKHEFYRSKFVSWLFPILQLIDIKIKWNSLKKTINNEDIVLFDRFSMDTLADLMVDTGRMNLHKTRIGRSFIKMIPEETRVLLLEVDEETIRKRKKDTLYDEHLKSKIEVFNLLSCELNLKTIDNNRFYEDVKRDVFNELDLYAGN